MRRILSFVFCFSLLGILLSYSHSPAHAEDEDELGLDEEMSGDEDGGPATEPLAAPTKDPTYQRIGGTKAIRMIVDDFVEIALKDERISSFFEVTQSDQVRLKTFKTLLVDQLCEAVGGPCHYMGKAMKDAHAGMGIKNEHFKAMLEDLTAAMEKNKVSKDDQVHLVKILAPFRTEIINAPAKPKPTMGAGGFR